MFNLLGRDGGERHLAPKKTTPPNVMDRVIQQAVLQILTPIFDPHFSESSFGFRPNRSAQDAAKQVQRYIRLGYRQCIDMDRHGRHGFGSDLSCLFVKPKAPVAIQPALPGQIFRSSPARYINGQSRTEGA
ncbi:MAG: hypothetical protein R3C49_28245 [Planctomycetaceae bacterium]